MQWKKYLVVFVALALLLVLSGVTSAQYSDEITDATDDVDYYYGSESGWGWNYDVERPDIDIVRASIQESNGEINVEIEVKGTVQSQEDTDSNLWYTIALEDGEGGSYEFTYYFGQLYMSWPNGEQFGVIEASGFGTSTLELTFSLEDVGNPDSLKITSVETYEYLESAGTGEYYTDTAEPAEDGAPPGDNGDTNTGEEDYTEFVDDLMERGMMCLLIAIIIPIIIVVIVIIVIIKIVKKDDKGGEQPPRQEYQQPPPPARSSQEPEMQYQGAPPPEETGGEISPGEDIMEEEEF